MYIFLVRLTVYLSFNQCAIRSVCLFYYLSIFCLSVCPYNICLTFFMSVCQFVCPSFAYLSVYLPYDLSVFLSVFLSSIHQSIFNFSLSIKFVLNSGVRIISIQPAIYPSIYKSIYPLINLSIN